MERQRAGAVRGRLAVPPADDRGGHEVAMTRRLVWPRWWESRRGNHQRDQRQGADLPPVRTFVRALHFVPIRVGGEYAHADREYPAQYLARQAQPLHFVEDR
ncbi:hypothetical protein M8494_07250 [Serratia ureilytica]